ncbi:TetR/AcrR family transcriptional regulator [Ktedonospora formicarum]|uniref:HTH tetR-type domain-containing protein n=1 Tax=Ktedonospora formicarum TaxID=2778364 RepID=A0A8J3MND7_9CHLR|nr:TetR/AcrR family transcriptional regulator [Ktedonospora formicarum]GHO42612.1 hypothetical protein KSX_07750 [Ktedonospora formicarum]
MGRINIRSIRRQQIVHAAEELAAQRGWAETTIADICKKADISVGGLTHHFKDKDDIMFAVLEDVIHRLHDRLVASVSKEEAQQNPGAFLHAFCQSIESDRSLYRLILHFASSSIHRPDIKQRLKAFFASLHQRDEAQCQEQEKRKDKPYIRSQAMADLLQCVGLGLILGYAFLDLQTPAEQMEVEAAKLLLPYIQYQSASSPQS